MIGYQTLLEARLHGYKPQAVFIEVLSKPANKRDRREAQNAIAYKRQVTLLIEPHEQVANIRRELIAINALPAIITGEPSPRLDAIVQAVAEQTDRYTVADLSGQVVFYSEGAMNHATKRAA